jgi:hypothetical protein
MAGVGVPVPEAMPARCASTPSLDITANRKCVCVCVCWGEGGDSLEPNHGANSRPAATLIVILVAHSSAPAGAVLGAERSPCREAGPPIQERARIVGL